MLPLTVSRLAESQRSAEAQRVDMEKTFLSHRESLDKEYSGHVEELRQSFQAKLAEMEAKSSADKALRDKYVRITWSN